METYKVTKSQQRLDQIVIHHYGDLSQFTAVTAANPHLTQVILAVGAIVNLPPRAILNSEETLW